MGKSVEELALLGDIASQNEVSEKGKLLPCPFCGGKAELHNFSTIFGTALYVRCERCWAKIVLYGDREKIIREWNRRHMVLTPEEMEGL